MALEQFNIENGKYPDSMMGWFDIPYKYHIQKNGSYNISFPFEEESNYTFNSEWNRWYDEQQ